MFGRRRISRRRNRNARRSREHVLVWGFFRRLILNCSTTIQFKSTAIFSIFFPIQSSRNCARLSRFDAWGYWRGIAATDGLQRRWWIVSLISFLLNLYYDQENTVCKISSKYLMFWNLYKDYSSNKYNLSKKTYLIIGKLLRALHQFFFCLFSNSKIFLSSIPDDSDASSSTQVSHSHNRPPLHEIPSQPTVRDFPSSASSAPSLPSRSQSSSSSAPQPSISTPFPSTIIRNVQQQQK